jgi:hypothetical protein
MALTKQDLLDQRESIQNDLICLLDGQADVIVDRACQIIVDRMNILIQKLEPSPLDIARFKDGSVLTAEEEKRQP